VAANASLEVVGGSHLYSANAATLLHDHVPVKYQGGIRGEYGTFINDEGVILAGADTLEGDGAGTWTSSRVLITTRGAEPTVQKIVMANGSSVGIHDFNNSGLMAGIGADNTPVLLLPVEMITINTFIPQNYLQPFFDVFAGDDRIDAAGKVIWNKNGSHRTQQKVNLIPFRNMGDADGMEDNAYANDPDGIKNDPVLNHVQETNTFQASTSIVGGKISAAARADNVKGAPMRLDWQTGTNSGMSVTPTWLGDRKIQVRYVVSADNPLASGVLWDNIDYDFTLILDFTDPANPTYSLSGSHDGFPAYEIYIGDKRIYDHDPISTGQGLPSLGPPMEYPVPASKLNQPIR
jgi:hypothetical protein